MSRFLFAWELGANFGHLARDLPVARQLRTVGYRVVFAVRDTRIAAELLDQHRFAYVQAPLPQTPMRLARPPANYAELLLAEGWGDRMSLFGRVRAWHALFALVRPDVLIADHAPTALLAARIAGICRVAFGSGFEIPPLASPLPSIRPWEEIPAERLRQSEAMVLVQANACAVALGGETLSSFADLFPPTPVLATFAELDHYGERENAAYVGSIHGIEHADVVAWPEGEGPRVFVYLRPGHPGVAAALAALAESGSRAVCVVPGIGKDLLEKFASPRLAIYPQPIATEPLLANASVAICHGSAGAVAEALLAGVPLLMMPTTVEQYLCAKRVVAFGGGIVLDKQIGKKVVAEALGTLCVAASHRQAARHFAGKYREYAPDRSSALAVKAILAACGETADGNMGASSVALKQTRVFA